MAGTFLKTTIRNLYREKIYAAINIAGLSLAIACCIILGLYLKSKLTYDMHNKNYKKIYRVEHEYNVNGKLERFARTSQLMGPMLKDFHSEIEDYVRVFKIGAKVLMKSEDKGFYWETTAFASKNIFDYFDHDIIYGDPEKLKTERFAAVSETFAKKYWGNENPVGKTISSEGFSVKITHVFADLPENSHLRYDIVQSDDIPYFAEPENANTRRALLIADRRWYTYLILPEDYNVDDFNEIAESFYKRHIEELLRQDKITWRFWLQPLAKIHYHSQVELDEPTGNIYYLYGFMAVAIFILLVACINYMNLATARAAKRAKEIGMRKILGSGRARLIIQFLGESIFFSLIALLIGYALVQLAMNLTSINMLLDNTIALKDLNDPLLLGCMVLFGLVLGLLSGIYPALYLSSVAPLTALVGTHKTGKGSIRLREMLVLIQFIISVSVIACTLFMTMQMSYISSKALGFDKENRLIITMRTADVIDKAPTIKTELLKNSSILGVSMNASQVIGKANALWGNSVANNEGVQEVITGTSMTIGKDFIKVMGLELVQGRDFSRRLITDVGDSYIVNEKMVERMGWEQPLGKRIGNGKVIGVVKDFHYDSLHKPIEAFVFQEYKGTQVTGQNRDLVSAYMVVNLAGEDIFRTLDFIADKFAEFDPKHPFEFEFLDDSLNKVYLNEKNLMSLTAIFAAICIFISCMGLFGLAAFTTEQRTKEIGIRKVLGSSTWQIIALLAQKILLLVLGGAVVASLIAYYAMDEWWLSDFTYRISINVNSWVFLVAAAIAAGVAFTTVALQSLKTAQSNPIDALRYE